MRAPVRTPPGTRPEAPPGTPPATHGAAARLLPVTSRHQQHRQTRNPGPPERRGPPTRNFAFFMLPTFDFVAGCRLARLLQVFTSYGEMAIWPLACIEKMQRRPDFYWGSGLINGRLADNRTKGSPPYRRVRRPWRSTSLRLVVRRRRNARSRQTAARRPILSPPWRPKTSPPWPIFWFRRRPACRSRPANPAAMTRPVR